MRQALRISLVLYLGLVLLITCWPAPERTAAPRWIDVLLAWSTAHGVPLTFEAAEAGANVLMFVPFGVLVLLLHGDGAADRTASGPLAPLGSGPVGRDAALVVATAAAFTATIETVQRVLPGRFSTLQDVVLNTTGAAVGVGAVLVVVVLRRLSAARASRRASRACDP